MLRIFKNHTLKTSLLDDFVYYENRQKIIQEEKASLLVRSFHNPFFIPALGPPRKLNCVVELPPSKVENAYKPSYEPNSSKKTVITASEQASSQSNIANTNIRNEHPDKGGVEAKDDASTLKIGSLSINPKASDLISSVGTTSTVATSTEPFSVTVGSVPLKFNGASESSGILTVGTIPLDPRALLFDKGGGGALTKKGSQQK